MWPEVPGHDRPAQRALAPAPDRVLASTVMRTWASILTIAKVCAGVATITVAGGCGGTKMGKVMADTPILPYEAPDIDELTGIETPDSDDATEAPAAAGAGSAQNPQK